MTLNMEFLIDDISASYTDDMLKLDDTKIEAIYVSIFTNMYRVTTPKLFEIWKVSTIPNIVSYMNQVLNSFLDIKELS